MSKPPNPMRIKEREDNLKRLYEEILYQIEPALLSKNPRKTNPPALKPGIQARVLRDVLKVAMGAFGVVVYPTFKRVFRQQLRAIEQSGVTF